MFLSQRLAVEEAARRDESRKRETAAALAQARAQAVADARRGAAFANRVAAERESANDWATADANSLVGQSNDPAEILGAMRERPGDARTQRQACFAIARLVAPGNSSSSSSSANAAARTQIVAGGAVRLLAESLRRYPRRADVQESALWAAAALARDSVSATTRLHLGGFQKLALQALSTGPSGHCGQDGHRGAQAAACAVLRQLAAGGVVQQVEILRSGAVQSLLAVLRRSGHELATSTVSRRLVAFAKAEKEKEEQQSAAQHAAAAQVQKDHSNPNTDFSNVEHKALTLVLSGGPPDPRRVGVELSWEERRQRAERMRLVDEALGALELLASHTEGQPAIVAGGGPTLLLDLLRWALSPACTVDPPPMPLPFDSAGRTPTPQGTNNPDTAEGRGRGNAISQFALQTAIGKVLLCLSDNYLARGELLRQRQIVQTMRDEGAEVQAMQAEVAFTPESAALHQAAKVARKCAEQILARLEN